MAPPLEELAAIPDAPPESLTVLLPSKDRPALLAALLSYFNEMRLPYPVRVLLSGTREKDLPGDYPNLDLHVMEFSPQTSLHAKLIAGMSAITTPLTALVADDDIVLPEGLKKSAGFLLQNPDYSACQGYHALFSEEGAVVNLASIAYFAPSQESDDPLVRLQGLLSRYQPVCWAVFRTDVARAFVSRFSENLNFLFNELLWAGISALLGKIKRLPPVYCLRRIDRMHFMGHPLFALLAGPQAFFTEYLAYRRVLMSFLPQDSSHSIQALERILDTIHIGPLRRELDQGILNHFGELILQQPDLSIHDALVDRLFRPPPPDVSSGWVREIPRDGRTYRFFPAIMDPEPRAEILLPPSFTQEMIRAVHAYFNGVN
jgi:glycosyltransferase domain-containing protein